MAQARSARSTLHPTAGFLVGPTQGLALLGCQNRRWSSRTSFLHCQVGSGDFVQGLDFELGVGPELRPSQTPLHACNRWLPSFHSESSPYGRSPRQAHEGWRLCVSLQLQETRATGARARAYRFPHRCLALLATILQVRGMGVFFQGPWCGVGSPKLFGACAARHTTPEAQNLA